MKFYCDDDDELISYTIHKLEKPYKIHTKIITLSVCTITHNNNITKKNNINNNIIHVDKLSM